MKSDMIHFISKVPVILIIIIMGAVFQPQAFGQEFKLLYDSEKVPKAFRLKEEAIKELNISDEQQMKIITFIHEYATDVAQLQTDIIKMKIEIQTLLHKKEKDDSEISKLMQDIVGKESDLRLKPIQINARVIGMFNSNQLQRLKVYGGEWYEPIWDIEDILPGATQCEFCKSQCSQGLHLCMAYCPNSRDSWLCRMLCTSDFNICEARCEMRYHCTDIQ